MTISIPIEKLLIIFVTFIIVSFLLINNSYINQETGNKIPTSDPIFLRDNILNIIKEGYYTTSQILIKIVNLNNNKLVIKNFDIINVSFRILNENLNLKIPLTYLSLNVTNNVLYSINDIYNINNDDDIKIINYINWIIIPKIKITVNKTSVQGRDIHYVSFMFINNKRNLTIEKETGIKFYFNKTEVKYVRGILNNGILSIMFNDYPVLIVEIKRGDVIFLTILKIDLTIERYG